MFLFKDKENVEISVHCKFCLQEIKYTVTPEEYKNTIKFPLIKEAIHGDPKHTLIISLNKNLEVENFEVKTLVEETTSYTKELTKAVLSEIELTDEEIELYFLTTGREAVSLGEMSILIDKSKEECERIARKFVEKGLFKEIIGVKPHFKALPPYAALVAQLGRFNEYISQIKKSAPKELNQSFNQLEAKAEGVKRLNEYAKFMQDLKEDALKEMYAQKKQFDDTISQIGQIKEVTNVIGNLEKDISGVLVNQLTDLKNEFQTILKKISAILKNQLTELRQEFQNVQTTTSENIAKLRLGVIQETVDQVIDKVFQQRLKDITKIMKRQLESIKNAFTEGIKNTIAGFNKNIINRLKSIIEEIINNVDAITTNTEKSGDEIKQIFAGVSKNFSQAVILAEEKLGGISDKVFKSFEDLKDTFSTRVIESLDSELGKILERLEDSEITTREFWEKEKESTGFTMKDIWFIRSIEGIIAHIDDEIAKAKMRLLIVVPYLADINIEKLKSLPRHINIRITATIDLASPEHKAILAQLDDMPNVTYRHRDLQNLWGINRDYEEVIISVISKTEIAGKEMIEIAGIGSIIEEHIKIFVPILEEAWVNSKKDISFALKPSAIGKTRITSISALSGYKTSEVAKAQVASQSSEVAKAQVASQSSEVAKAQVASQSSVLKLKSPLLLFKTPLNLRI
ncbi:MAG: hypothetical protein ACTSR8_06590 [Promethearchaeota archaeon]